MGSKCSFYKHGQAQSLGHPMSFKAGMVSLLVLVFGLQAKVKREGKGMQMRRLVWKTGLKRPCLKIAYLIELTVFRTM